MSSACSEVKMKTIKELIRISNENLEAVREIRRRERMHKVYSECEELKDTDAEIVSAHKRRLVAVIDRDDKLIARLDAEIDKLNDRRERIIEANGIDPDFDQEVTICSKCSDTGFTTGKGGTVQVCSCREDDVKECFTYSGLEHFTSYDNENYRSDYLGEPEARKAIRNKLLMVMLGVGEEDQKPLWVYYAAPQTGKTYLSVCLVKTAIRLGKSAYYSKCEDLADIGSDTLEQLNSIDLLVIDDFADDVTLNHAVGSTLNNLIEIRNAAGLKTILVTSIPVSSLITGCDMRISGKLKNAGTI